MRENDDFYVNVYNITHGNDHQEKPVFLISSSSVFCAPLILLSMLFKCSMLKSVLSRLVFLSLSLHHLPLD